MSNRSKIFCQQGYVLSGDSEFMRDKFYCGPYHQDALKTLGEDALSHPELLHKVCDMTAEDFEECPYLYLEGERLV